jgi:hypothetical protein
MNQQKPNWIELALHCKDCGALLDTATHRRCRGRCRACHDRHYRSRPQDVEPTTQLLLWPAG